MAEPVRAIELGSRALVTGCRIGGLAIHRDQSVQFMGCRPRDGMGKNLSRQFPFFPASPIFPFKSGHFAGFKAEGPLSWCRRIEVFVSHTTLFRFVPPGPRSTAWRATEVRGKCQDDGAFSRWCHTTMVRRRHKAWQAANDISYANAIALWNSSVPLARRQAASLPGWAVMAGART